MSRRMLSNDMEWLKRHPAVIGGPVILVIGWLDYVSGTEIGLSLLYLVPIALVAWMSSRFQAILCAVVAAACWLAADHAGRPASLFTISFWNSITRLVIYLVTAYLVNRVRRDRDNFETLNSELQHAFRREAELARTDVLTGLPNSRAFLENLAREIARARRDKRGLCVLFLDLDDFKSINDHYGHAAGDSVLTNVGKLIREVVRGGDVVARMGGDEYAILLWHTPQNEAVHIAERLTARVAQFAADYPKARLGVSIGVAWFDEPPTDPDEILGVADREMYEEKAARKSDGQMNDG